MRAIWTRRLGIRRSLPPTYAALAADAAIAGGASLAAGVAAGATWVLSAILGLAVAGCAAAVLSFHDAHKPMWRYASMRDLILLGRPALWTAFASAPLVIWVMGAPAAIGVYYAAHAALFFSAAASARGGYRFSKRAAAAPRRRAILVAGDGDAAEPFLRQVEHDRHSTLRVVGVLDRATGHEGRRIRNVPILGDFSDVASAADLLERRGERPCAVVLTGEAIPADDIQTLLKATIDAGLRLSRAPKLDDLAEAAASGRALPPIKFEEVLGRSARRLDHAPVAEFLRDRRVLVTGAGGSIGGELVRQVAARLPAQLTLFDNSEASLYAIDLELSEGGYAFERRAVLTDVRDRERMLRSFEEARPDIVLHAAALKHVPLMESHPHEAALTNVLGTMNAVDAARASGARHFILVSTDKAVRPANVMGMTKRAAELYVQANDLSDGVLSLAAVRFGNVLGSAGSVTPLFQRQIARGGPVTVTHPEMRRYFMTLQEAAALTLQAGAVHARTDEQGVVYALDMGEPMRIVDLATQLILHSGRKPEDVPIVFTGLRPGERLMEELSWGADTPEPTDIPGLLRSRPPFKTLSELNPRLETIVAAARGGGDVAALLRALLLTWEDTHGATRAAGG